MTLTAEQIAERYTLEEVKEVLAIFKGEYHKTGGGDCDLPN